MTKTANTKTSRVTVGSIGDDSATITYKYKRKTYTVSILFTDLSVVVQAQGNSDDSLDAQFDYNDLDDEE